MSRSTGPSSWRPSKPWRLARAAGMTWVTACCQTIDGRVARRGLPSEEARPDQEASEAAPRIRWRTGVTSRKKFLEVFSCLNVPHSCTGLHYVGAPGMGSGLCLDSPSGRQPSLCQPDPKGRTQRNQVVVEVVAGVVQHAGAATMADVTVGAVAVGNEHIRARFGLQHV